MIPLLPPYGNENHPKLVTTEPIQDKPVPKSPHPDTEKVTKILTAARGIIKKGWCQDYLALDARGRPVEATSKKAKKFCAYGAVAMATSLLADEQDRERLELLAITHLERINQVDHIPTWNDRWWMFRWVILRGFDKAINTPLEA